MTDEKFNRANELKKRIENLEAIQKYLEKVQKVYILAEGYRASDSVKVSEEVKIILLCLCSEETKRMKEEFERL